MYESVIRGLGHEARGGFTAVRGFDRALAPRRIALDQAGIAAATAAGATVEGGDQGRWASWEPDRTRTRFEAWSSTTGGGSTHRGCSAPTVAAQRLPACSAFRRSVRCAGEMSMAYGYWRGIPDDGYGCFHIEVGKVLTSVPVEDGLHMLIAAGAPEMVHGTQQERREPSTSSFVRGFPETVSPDVLDRASLVTEVAYAPEPLMRGFFRRPNGPGWALLGDACHFKHPGTAQGIGDALEQGVYVAEALSSADATLEGYEAVARRPRGGAL